MTAVADALRAESGRLSVALTEVDRDDVPGIARLVAGLTAVVAAGALDVAPPAAIAWFAGPGLQGFLLPDQRIVALNADQPIDDLVDTVAHEVAHIGGRDEPGAEAYARAFAGVVAGPVIAGAHSVLMQG